MLNPFLILAERISGVTTCLDVGMTCLTAEPSSCPLNEWNVQRSIRYATDTQTQSICSIRVMCFSILVNLYPTSAGNGIVKTASTSAQAQEISFAAHAECESSQRLRSRNVFRHQQLPLLFSAGRSVCPWRPDTGLGPLPLAVVLE